MYHTPCSLQEYAGLGGDANHIKTELQTQTAFKLPFDFSISAAFREGLVFPLQNKTHIADRFFIGGPTDIRGFDLSTVGPHDKSTTPHD
jgi:outer membrane protein insertion porin family